MLKLHKKSFCISHHLPLLKINRYKIMVSSVRVYEKGDQGTTNQEGHLLLRNTKKVKDSHKVILEGEAT